MPRRSSSSTTRSRSTATASETSSSSSYHDGPGHYVSLTTTGQPTASVNAKQGKLTSETLAASGHWANTDIASASADSSADKNASSSSSKSGWSSLSNDVHIAIYAVAAVLGLFLLVGLFFCIRRRKTRAAERRFQSRTTALRESFISSPAQLQEEKEKQLSYPSDSHLAEQTPVELSAYGGGAAHRTSQAQLSRSHSNVSVNDIPDYYSETQQQQQRSEPKIRYVLPEEGYQGRQANAYQDPYQTHQVQHQHDQHYEQSVQSPYSWEQPYSPPAQSQPFR